MRISKLNIKYTEYMGKRCVYRGNSYVLDRYIDTEREREILSWRER